MVINTATLDRARGLDRHDSAGRASVAPPARARSVVARRNARVLADVNTRLTSPLVGIALLLAFAIVSALGLGPVAVFAVGAAVILWTVGFAQRLSLRGETARR
ncbi:hypothetical protein [Marisediminicola sp. LYQ85]|uniref:hypothetical protein n=1 Tax=Marisediminicola sp. LYQ85 TaxID=3391062 RepID=UPI003983A04F